MDLPPSGREAPAIPACLRCVNVHIKGGDVRGHREVLGVISASLVLWCIDPSRNGDTTRAMYHLLCLFRLAASKDIHELKLPIIMHILLFSSRTLFAISIIPQFSNDNNDNITMRGVQGWAPMIQVSTSGAPNIICHSKYSGASKLAETCVSWSLFGRFVCVYAVLLFVLTLCVCFDVVCLCDS